MGKMQCMKGSLIQMFDLISHLMILLIVFCRKNCVVGRVFTITQMAINTLENGRMTSLRERASTSSKMVKDMKEIFVLERKREGESIST